MKIIDTHVHLDHLEDLEGALERSRQSGVEAIVCVGMDLKSNQRNLEIKRSVSALVH